MSSSSLSTLTSELREFYYALICQVLKRGELSLGQLGYHSIDKLSKS